LLGALLEQGRIDKRRGPQMRRRAEERARKYEGWAKPLEPLAAPERSTPDGYESPSDVA
jgi:hypothetical protein